MFFRVKNRGPVLATASTASIVCGFLTLAVSVCSPAVLANPAGDPLYGVRVYQLKSPYQGKGTSLRILAPTDLSPDRRYRVLFVLPVHEDGLFKHGDGLLEVQKLNIHNKHQLICVAPAFSSQPWYADHDQDPTKRDESHLLKTVIPFVEENYHVRTDRSGRLLVGFSKSGWGAMTLLLRHPDKFHKAAAWDPGVRIDVGPLSEGFDRESRIRRCFGSDENFEKFRLTTLLRTRGKELGDEVRLFYFNRDGHDRALGGARIHLDMVERRIPHRYVMEPYRDHRWDSGWLPEALEFLIRD